MKNRKIPMIIIFICIAQVANAASSNKQCMSSSAWGVKGEKWIPEKRIPDFSYAGYRAGEAKLPYQNAKWDFKKDFGGVGDGKTDDTQAFKKAISEISNGVLFFPAGTYLFTEKLIIEKGNIVLRGEGPGKTIFLFNKSLENIMGNSYDKQTGYSQWSFGPGLININGKDPINTETFLTKIISPSKRGERTLKLATDPGLEVGQWIRLVESDPPKNSTATGSLVSAIYGNMVTPGLSLLGTQNIVRFLSRIYSICKSKDGTFITLERPLPYDFKPEWQPEVHRFAPTVEEVGFEQITIEFPWTPYPGHFKEKGYNALFFNRVANCWAKNVEVVNSDYAISLNSTDFCTVTDIKLRASKDRGKDFYSEKMSGHHGIDVSFGTENLVTRFKIETSFFHDISVEWYALHTVFSHGKGVDLNMDHHREANYSSLFTDLDCGDCRRPFESGGKSDRGAHAGAYSTFWNIHGKPASIPWPASDFGPLLNFVGVYKNEPKNQLNWFVDKIITGILCPADLHDAMVEKRLGR